MTHHSHANGKHAIIKTCSYGTMHMVVAIIVAYLLSNSWKVALAIGLVEPCVQTVAYFFHEKAWHKLELKQHRADVHNEIINSVSPLSDKIEETMHDKSGKIKE